jgi:beta-1,2-mannosyltransferase
MEPIIIFNMLSPSTQWKRAMYVHRPLTKTTTVLTIRGVERPRKEKNWAPFFLSGLKPSHENIFFVWKHIPLTIIRCSLRDGMCDIIFEEEVAPELVEKAIKFPASLRGGTQFLPVPLPRGVSTTGTQAFVAFSRHQVRYVPYTNCERPCYRPELEVLTTNGTHFYLAYVSEPIDFGPGVIFSSAQLSDSCGSGRILIPNSIARWDTGITVSDTGPGQLAPFTDAMTLTLTINDNLMQVIQLAGAHRLLQSLPSLASYFGSLDTKAVLRSDVFDATGKNRAFEKAALAGRTIRSCLEATALKYTRDRLETKQHG